MPELVRKIMADAYHEAGHAVLAILCGHRVVHVDMRPDDHKGFAASIRHGEGEFELQLALLPDLMTENDGNLFASIDLENSQEQMSDDQLRRYELVCLMDTYSGPEQEVFIASAGGLAHQKYEPDSFNPETCDQDWEDAFEHLLVAADQAEQTVEETKSHLIEEAANLLDRDDVWSAVMALANELKPNELIDGEIATETLIAALVGIED